MVQDNSGPLPTMRLVNIVENKIINVSVLSNRQQSFIVKTNALAAQNLRKLATQPQSPQLHEASPRMETATSQLPPKKLKKDSETPNE